MYQQLTDVPTGFPILDDLRLALLTQRVINEWRDGVCKAVCAFIDQKMVRRDAFTASAENIKYFHVDCYGKTTVHYDAGTFDLVFKAVRTNDGIVLEVVGVAHTNPFQIGIVALVGERVIYRENQSGQ